jgi:histone H3/H4
MDEGLNMIQKTIDESSAPVQQEVVENKSYQDAKDELTDISKALGVSLKRLIGVDKTNLVQLSAVSKEVAGHIPKLLEAAKVAASNTSDEELKKQLMLQASELANNAKSVLIVCVDVFESYSKTSNRPARKLQGVQRMSQPTN